MSNPPPASLSPGSRPRPGALAGVAVLVTRPLHQADALARRIESAGGQAVCFPVLEIGYPDASPAFARLAQRVGEFDLLIFISINAVNGWMRLLQPHCQRPLRASLFAVGGGTARAMKSANLPTPLQPHCGAGSAELLKLPELSRQAVAERRVLIVRGAGGRELLGNTLVARGASVEYLEVYRRMRPVVSPAKLLMHRGKIHAIVVTSVEALSNLFEMGGLEAKPWLSRMPFVTVSERIAGLARSMGVQGAPIVADDASDEAIVTALCHWQQRRQQRP